MLHRMRRAPVAGQSNGENHGAEKCVPKPETAPYPKRKDGAGGENQGLGSFWRRPIMDVAEKSGFYARAKKANRAYEERFLDPVAIQAKLGNGDFGCSVAGGRKNQEKNASSLARWSEKKNREKKAGGGPHDDRGKEKKDEP